MKKITRITVSALAFLTLGTVCMAQGTAEAAPVLSENLLDLAMKVATWYGVACIAFNSLVSLLSTVVKATPGTSDDEAVNKIYENKIYKAVAWVFSWGDYIAELVAKLRNKA